jgi:hypothetical protein
VEIEGLEEWEVEEFINSRWKRRGRGGPHLHTRKIRSHFSFGKWEVDHLLFPEYIALVWELGEFVTGFTAVDGEEQYTVGHVNNVPLHVNGQATAKPQQSPTFLHHVEHAIVRENFQIPVRGYDLAPHFLRYLVGRCDG